MNDSTARRRLGILNARLDARVSKKTIRMIGCFGALGASIGLGLSGFAMWNINRPNFAIALLMLAMVAVCGALWQYNQARFE